jgi:hypothetical protein
MPPTDDADVHSAAQCHLAHRGQQEPISCRPSGPPGTPTNTPALGDTLPPTNSEPWGRYHSVEITTYAVAVVERCSGIGHDAAGHHASMGGVSRTPRTRGECAARDLDAYVSPQCYFSSRGDAEVHSTAWLLCAPWATRSAKLSPARSTGTPTNTLRSETDLLPPTNISARSQSRSEDPRLGGTHQSEP